MESPLEIRVSEDKFRRIEDGIFKQKTKAETIDEFLERGGKIRRLSSSARSQKPEKEMTEMAKAAKKQPEVVKEAPPANRAKDAADMVNKAPHMPVDEIITMIPKYNNALHKNQWLSTFFKHLSPEIREQIESPIKLKVNPPKPPKEKEVKK